MRTLAEGSIDRARAKRTQRGQGLRPPAVTRRATSEMKWASCPIPLSLREIMHFSRVSDWPCPERGRRRNRMWLSRPIPLSPWERVLELWERERTSEMKWASCPIPLSPWSEWECSRIEREREGTESDRTIPSLSPWERGKWKKWALQPLKKRQIFHKLAIFSTSVVKKWIFVIKMYSFLKNMLYLFTWTYQRGALICLRNSKRPSKNLTK